MVCVPCIVVPFLMVIYLKFVQPFILRFVPERWKTRFDSWLYPTCPVSVPKKRNESEQMVQKAIIDPADAQEEKKEL
jgi:hypothetical protein